MSKERLEHLLDTVHGLDQLIIFPHNDPDPDAIASAVALRYLLAEKVGLTAQILYKGIIGRAENRALVRYLGHPLQPLDEITVNQATPIALIDTQPGVGNNPWTPDATTLIIVDHHPWRKKSAKAAFADVQAEVGATSTMLLGYLQTARLELPTWLATALFYGIKTDTAGLSRDVSSVDVAAYFYLQSRLDVDALAEIERAQVPAAYFKSFANTLEAARLYNNVAIAYIGPMDYPDMTAEVADLLLRLEEIEWVICFGVYHDNLLLAIRAPEPPKDAGLLAQAIVDEEGVAGGHSSMGGGQIPLKGRDPDQLVEQLKQRALRQLLITSDVAGRTLI